MSDKLLYNWAETSDVAPVKGALPKWRVFLICTFVGP